MEKLLNICFDIGLLCSLALNAYLMAIVIPALRNDGADYKRRYKTMLKAYTDIAKELETKLKN